MNNDYLITRNYLPTVRQMQQETLRNRTAILETTKADFLRQIIRVIRMAASQGDSSAAEVFCLSKASCVVALEAVAHDLQMEGYLVELNRGSHSARVLVSWNMDCDEEEEEEGRCD